jgi:purine-binding chemotaxis protein CheW
MQATILNTEASAAPAAEARAERYLTFHLGPEEFGIRVLKVREIMGIQDIAAVPEMPPHAKGVIRLRGKIVPVVDLRLKFGLPQTEYTQRTCLVVVQAGTTTGSALVGVVVDAVSEVLYLAAGDIAKTPKSRRGAAAPYLLGVAKAKGKVKILADIDRVLSAQELKALDGLVSSAGGRDEGAGASSRSLKPFRGWIW